MKYCKVCGKLLPQTEQENQLFNFTQKDKSLKETLKTEPDKCVLCSCGLPNKQEVLRRIIKVIKQIKQTTKGNIYKGRMKGCYKCMYFKNNTCNSMTCKMSDGLNDNEFRNIVKQEFYYSLYPIEVRDFFQKVLNKINLNTTMLEISKEVDKYWYMFERV